MFTFGFSRDADSKENENAANPRLEWLPASQIDLSSVNYDYRQNADEYLEYKIFAGIKLKLIRPDTAVRNLLKENAQNIVEAESQHSDLIPAKYEGGLKLWECSYDLGEFLLEKRVELGNTRVLDLGCGSGVIGILALLKGAVVHFQDYNMEVIKSVTIPNVLLNYENHGDLPDKCEFYSGDWASFTALSAEKYPQESEKYDLILTSETIYNPDNHRKLYDVFKQRLKQTGVVYVAAKTYYFGVGGGLRQFENLIKEDGYFRTDVVWQSKEGLQREILRLLWK